MKPQPFKFRHVNRLAGAFVFLVLAMVIVLIGFAGKAQQWFVPSSQFRVRMPEGGTLGITAGSDVRVFGNHVGHVKSVELVSKTDLSPISSFENVNPSDLEIVAVLSVKGDFSHFIGSDSEAVLKHDLGGLGAAYFDISRGTGIRKKGDDQLTFSEEKDVKKEMMEIVDELKDVALPAVKEIKRASGETADLVAKLSEDDGQLFTSLDTMNSNLERLDAVIKMIEDGKGALGLLLNDESTRTDIKTLISSLSGTATSLKETAGRVDNTIAKLDTGIDPINEATLELPGIMQNTDRAITGYAEAAVNLNEVLREAEILTEGIQKHWLIRKNMHDPIEDPKPDEATARQKKASAGPPRSLKR